MQDDEAGTGLMMGFGGGGASSEQGDHDGVPRRGLTDTSNGSCSAEVANWGSEPRKVKQR